MFIFFNGYIIIQDCSLCGTKCFRIHFLSTRKLSMFYSNVKLKALYIPNPDNTE